METFHIERRERRFYSTFFPESVTKERHVWGQSDVGVGGDWIKYRFVIGDLTKWRTLIQTVANEYNPIRARKEFIDGIKTFERAEAVRATPLEYWDYSGRIETSSRETLFYSYRTGQRFGLERDQGVGFRGVLTQSKESWSIEAYALEQILRYRLYKMYTGKPFVGISVAEPWKLRNALEKQSLTLLRVVWAEYLTEPTVARLDAVIRVEQEINNYALQSLNWLQHMSKWETMKTLPFPGKAGALGLWDQGRMPNLDFDQTEPWYREVPKNPVSTVTMVRAAYFTNGRIHIKFTMNPRVSILTHPYLKVMHQHLTYGPPILDGISQVNWDRDSRRYRPFVGYSIKNDPAWEGHMPTPGAWGGIGAEGALAEPKLTVYPRMVMISPKVAERLSAILTQDKPTLVCEDLNRARGLTLVLPNLFWKVNIVPLFGSSRVLKPIDEYAKISGWAVNTVPGVAQMNPLFMPPAGGFLPLTTGERPIREGAAQEILPYS